MKKILCLCFNILLLIGCTKEGRNVSYEYSEGDLKLTFTRDYIIIDSCTGFNGFNQAWWVYEKTISRSDSVACNELLERLLKK
jgi:hypothetical protein